MITLFVKEINDLLNSLIGYIVIGVFLVGNGLLMWVFPETSVLNYGYTSMEVFFNTSPYVLMFLAPAVTMKSFAEEKRNGTLEILCTLPIGETNIILGKFFAAAFLIIFAILPTSIYYFILYYLGNPVGNIDTGSVVGSYFALLLLGALFASIGIWASMLAKNQVVAFVFASFLCFCLYSGLDSIASIEIWSDFSYYLRQLGVFSHYQVFSKGLIRFSDVIYLLSVICFFLFCTKVTLNIYRK